MSDFLKNHYKPILYIGISLIILPLVPVFIEMLLKLGQAIGTWIRLLGTNGMCF